MPADVEDQTEEQPAAGELDAQGNHPPPPPASSPDAEPPPSPSPQQVAQQTPQPETQPVDQTGTIPQQPQGTPPATVLKQAPHSGFRGVLDRVLDAIAGTQGSELYTDDQGNTYVQHPYLTEGQKWARVAGTLVGGAANGWAAGRGGNPGGAAAAGFNTGMQIRNQGEAANDKNVATARQMNEDNINHQLLTQKIIENTLANKRMGIEASQHDMKFEQEAIKQEEALHSKFLGTYTDANNLTEVQKLHPGVIKDFYNTKNIIAIPHADAQGHGGVSLYLRTPDAGSELLPPGTEYKTAELDDKTGKYVWGTRTSPEPITVDERTARNNAAAATMTGQTKTDAEAQHQKLADKELQTKIDAAPTEKALKEEQIRNMKSEEAEHYALADKNKRIQAGQELPLTPEGKVDLTRVPPLNIQTAQQIAAGDQRINDVVGRAAPAQRQYWMQLAEAIDPTFTGRDFERRQRTANDYAPGGTYGKQIISFNQYLRHLQNVTDAIEGLRNTNSEWLNIPLNELRSKALSNPALAALLPSLIASRKELQTFLNGGHALQKADIKDGEELMNEDMAPGTMEASAFGGAMTAADRLDEVNNGHIRVFKRGVDGILSPESAQTLRNFKLGAFADRLSTMGAQPNEQTPPPNTHVFSASAWLSTHPGGNVEAAKAEATRQKYQVVP